MEKEQKYFVKTTDEEVAKRLREAGFVELAKEGSHFVFLNQADKMVFAEEDLDLNYDNKLCFG